MDALQVFGLSALGAGLVFYALENKYKWALLGFALACALGAVYGFLLRDAWPFGIVEAVWSLVALRRWSTWERDHFKQPDPS